MRHKGFKSISDDLESFLFDLWNDILENEKGVNGDVKARIIGINCNNRTFDFFLEIGITLQSQTDPFHKRHRDSV